MTIEQEFTQELMIKGIQKYLRDLELKYLPLVFDINCEKQHLSNVRRHLLVEALVNSSSIGFNKVLNDKLKQVSAVEKIMTKYEFGNYIYEYRDTIKVMKLIKRYIKHYNLEQYIRN